ncbi:efflux RND transporter periplasmic adaptor subunit [Vaginella massiliensis]|uniref:efflux RND transporter periplasmic adaptor subunit n=1 Tax=Vaginella massiliensis TaxID=1816680 RepID=UPI00083834B8|nr:efflux RND transporter periplasmic adaptor subunit [Vaginella massiliensis]
MKKRYYLLMGITASIISSCNKNDQNAMQAQGPMPYPVVEVPTKVVESFSEFPATIEGINNNAVRAKIQGYVTNVYVDEGQYVSAGQPLFKLETNVLTQSANAAKSGVASSVANVKAAQANVNAASARVQAAQVEVNKLIPLVEKNIISNVQLETAKASLAQAQAAHNQAQAALAQAQAGQSQAQAGLNEVNANINYSVVRSPISGVVGAINFREGSLVGPTDQVPLTNVSNTSKVYAYFSMNEAEYLNFIIKTEGKSLQEKLNNMPAVELVLANGDIYPEKGRIQAVTGQIDPTTGTIQFRVTFSNADKILSNGNTGTIRIPKTYVDAVVVPESSTFEQQGYVYIYKVEKDTARQTMIEVEDRANNMVIVKDGLKKGEKIVAQSVDKVKDKTAVKPVPANFDSIVNSIKKLF